MSNKRWGCPWHGLVEDGGLQTPAGRLYIGYPSHGDTHLIDFGMPAVDTPAEHQSRGMAWLNKAIISGGRLHGKQLPAGSWIWRDDNDENWLVQTDLQGSFQASPIRSVTLTRFGVLGGEPVQHSYSVPGPDFVSDIQAAYLDEPSPGHTCFMFSAHPTGKEVIFRVGGGSASYHQPTSSWLLVELSGTGDNCNISISILRTAMQTKGTAIHTGPDDFGVSREFKRPSLDNYTQLDAPEGGPPTCGGVYVPAMSLELIPQQSEMYGVSYTKLDHDGAEIVDKLSDVIIGMVHDPSGNIQEVTATLERRVTASAPEPTLTTVDPTLVAPYVYDEPFDRCVPGIGIGTPTEGSINKQLTQTVKFESGVSISVNGEVQIEDWDGFQCHMEENVTAKYMWSAARLSFELLYNDYDVSHTYTVILNGEVYSHTYLGDDANSGVYKPYAANNIIPDLRNLPRPDNSNMSIAVPELTPEDLFPGYAGYLRSKLSISDATAAKTTLSPHVFANGVYGIRRREGGSAQHTDEVVTPSGTLSVSDGYYASFNPITGQVARSNNRVNWI